MKRQTQKPNPFAENPIPEPYRKIVHAHHFTCVFSCKVGKRFAAGQMGITSSNLDPRIFEDAEQKAIVRSDPELVIKRGSVAFVYHLINKSASARLYRVAAHWVDFAQGQY
jgi:hypothetical protein